MPATRLADVFPSAHVDHADGVAASSTSFEWWSPRFPSPAGLDLAARMFSARPAWAGEEGPRPRLEIAAGAFRVTYPDLARRERTQERAEQARGKLVDAHALHLAGDVHQAAVAAGERWCDECPRDPEPSREITEWSSKSRANMVLALCQLDYRVMLGDRTRVPAMLTLTYPGDWLAVAPDGRTAKRHLQMLRKRYVKAWGVDLVAVWKLEFQLRGAPHFHLLMVPPHGRARIPGARARKAAWVGAGLIFREWLSAVWADIVAHPDPAERERHRLAGTGVDYAEGLRARDPKRVAVYFTKHGSFAKKEYQNRVPASWQEPGKGPGRFWGYWGLARVAVAVEVDEDQAVNAARIVRRWARAQGTTRQVSVPRAKGGQVRSQQALVQGLAGAQFAAAYGTTAAAVRRQPRGTHIEGMRPLSEITGRDDVVVAVTHTPATEMVEQSTTRRRNVRRRVRRLRNGRGFVSVNNGQDFALAVSRALDVMAAPTPVEAGSPMVRLDRIRAAWMVAHAAGFGAELGGLVRTWWRKSVDQ